ncbi:MAG: hypothetical protein ACLRSW_15400, partial [Christensenellaceae bacterium]
EQGTIIFIGSTTENPYASMTPAIVSRCRVFEFKRLTEEDISEALRAALKNRHKGLGKMNIEADDDAIAHIARMAGGDLRSAYNALELAAMTTDPDADGKVHISLKDAEESIQRKALSYNEMTNTLSSAFCKSLRGSDANAALYYAMSHRAVATLCSWRGGWSYIRRGRRHSDPALYRLPLPPCMPLASAIEGLIPFPGNHLRMRSGKSYSVKNAMLAAKTTLPEFGTLFRLSEDNSFGSRRTRLRPQL